MHIMLKRFKPAVWFVAGALAFGFMSAPARAQSEASLVLSALPVASVVGTASAVTGSAAVAGAAVAEESNDGAAEEDGVATGNSAPASAAPAVW